MLVTVSDWEDFKQIQETREQCESIVNPCIQDAVEFSRLNSYEF